MIFKNITILDENYMARENMYLGIKDEIIDYIGCDEPMVDYGEQYDGRREITPCPDSSIAMHIRR